jgi:hypothetical protein
MGRAAFGTPETFRQVVELGFHRLIVLSEQNRTAPNVAQG